MKRAAVASGILAAVIASAAVARVSDFPAKGSLFTAESRALVFRGETRNYLIQRVRAGNRHPVVILLHGGDSDAKRVWTETSLPTLGARDGFIVVAPNASMNQHWNDGRGSVGQGKPSTADDVGYLKALIATVEARDSGDADAVFMVGVSNGGIMTMRFACESSRLLHAAGSVISNLSVKQAARCHTGNRLPWISINGDADPRVPFNGGAAGYLVNGRPQTALESADRTFAFFADRAGCSVIVHVEAVAEVDPSDGSTVEKRVRQGCAGNTTSTQYVLHNAGHNWPGIKVDSKRVRIYGVANEDIDAGSVIWAHFRQTLRR